ncbi:hypothetical protein RND71_018446 [Anisodus tanguticus]|uniref:Uncharacterized protein n=1 Tax=Anisodus tanguticus TaxID=243964 RepID=A0AAE1VK84_9SOLA|nr:hypothetical protein RND71_018446 [Anisodus tanguticus]
MERDHADVVTPGKMDQNDIHGFEPANLNNANHEPNALRVSTSPNIMETLTQKPTEQKTYTRKREPSTQ